LDPLSTIIRIVRPLDCVSRIAGSDRAAVTLIIGDSEGLDVLFVKRVESASDPWSGQIALPGGKFELEDGNMIGTAIRETLEEAGIDLRSQGRLVGALDDIRPSNRPNLVVTPFVALVEDTLPPTLGPEIQEAFWAPLRGLERTRFETVLTSGRRWSGEAYRYRSYIIWGLTGQIVERFLSLLQA
jgi:8-oxo-dGTP diphosphatase